MPDAKTPSIFISYSHDSDAHKAFVRSVAGQLRNDGLDCQIDQYINGFPPEGWQRWMETQVEEADFVLLVCTEKYLQRYRGQDPDGGRGVNFEGVVVSQTLYDVYYRNTKFIPVIPDGGSLDHVPLPLKGFSTFALPQEYTVLYRVLTGQHATPAPCIGKTLELEPEVASKYFVNTINKQVEKKPAGLRRRDFFYKGGNVTKVLWLASLLTLVLVISNWPRIVSTDSVVKIIGSNRDNSDINVKGRIPVYNPTTSAVPKSNDTLSNGGLDIVISKVINRIDEIQRTSSIHESVNINVNINLSFQVDGELK